MEIQEPIKGMQGDGYDDRWDEYASGTFRGGRGR